jgi:hypothetical protein
MKKKFFILLFTFFFLISNGQKLPTEYGFHAGVNLNSAYGTGVDKDHRDILTGLSVGGHIKINLKRQFGLKIILAYDQFGWAYRDLYFADNTGTGLAKGGAIIKINYLNLPVLAEYSFGKKIRFNIDAGMFFGVLLNNWFITKDDPSSPGQVTEAKTSSAYRNSTNFGACLGFGTHIPVATKIKLNIDLRNSMGLSNVSKTPASPGTKIKTNTFSILSGVAFEL